MSYRDCSFDRALIFIRSNRSATIFRAYEDFFFFYSPANCIVTKRLQSRVGGREEGKMHCCSQRPRIALRFIAIPPLLCFSPQNSRLISLDPLEPSKFSTLTDTNTAVAPPRGTLQSVLDRFTRVIPATILRSDIGFSRSEIDVSRSCKIYPSFTYSPQNNRLLLTNRNT